MWLLSHSPYSPARLIICTGNSVYDMKDNHRDRTVLRKPFSEKELVKVLTRLFPP